MAKPSSPISKSITVSLSDLLKGKEKLGHATGPKRKISIVKMNPVVGNKQLIIGGLAHGSSLYTISLVLNSINYYSEPKSGSLTVRTANGDVLYCDPINIKDTKALVRCSCPDFYYTWSWWDKQNKVLSGPAMKPYIRKTKTYPERNRLHVPGACKHLIGLVDRLRQDRIIK